MRKKLILLLIITIVCFLICSLNIFADESEYYDLSEFAGKRIGVQTATKSANEVDKFIKNPNRVYFSSIPEALVGLENNKIDALIDDEPCLNYFASQLEDIHVETLNSSIDLIAFAFAKNENGAKWVEKMNEFINELKANGELKTLQDKWLVNYKNAKMSLDYLKLPNTNGTINVATTFIDPPYSFIKDEEVVGYEIELIALFCQKYGYKPNIINCEFTSVIPGLVVDKYDIGAYSFSITEERKNNLYFSEPIYSSQYAFAFKEKFNDIEQKEYCDLSKFEGKRIGVETASKPADEVDQFIKNPERVYFSKLSDTLPALENNKIDAIMDDEPEVRYLASQHKGIRVETIDSPSDLFAFAFPKTQDGAKLASQMNEVINELKDSGELKKLEDKWLLDTANAKMSIDYSDLENINGEINIATSFTNPPFNFVKDEEIVGYELEILAIFCQKYGYKPNISNCEFASIIAGLTAGKYDIGAHTFSITEERKNKFYFSEPTYISQYALAFKEENYIENISSGIIQSFNRTFIAENRWKSFVSGAVVTLKITIFSILIGTALGFLWYLLCRKNIKLINAISKLVRWLIRGLPVVLLLMLLYYIVFGSTNLSGEIVSIIAFSVLFACYMISTMETAVSAVDPGQYIAAKALGYSDRKAFFRIILPQASKYIWPSYIEEITSHIKETAVVGYITVVDLTRAGDIIRGTTYEPFFPLISIAIVYFILAGMLKAILRKISKRTDFYNRKEEKILKGVNR